jgi:hypothetical protein
VSGADKGSQIMSPTTFRIVPRDGGFAYRLGDTLSENYPTRDLAEAAARDAARRQELSGEEPEAGATIRYPDETGRLRAERTGPDDRPDSRVDRPDED